MVWWLLTDGSDCLWNYIVVPLMVVCALWFTVRTRFVQFMMFPEMLKLAYRSNKVVQGSGKRSISSFEAFIISLASRVGVGNLAGVALAITVGGPGSIFWMWVMAVLNAATAFVEATLAQLFKSRAGDAFIGGPAYYIYKGLGSRFASVVIAVLSIVTFSFTMCSVQANTIAISAKEAFGIDPWLSAAVVAVLMVVIIFGGVQWIAKASSAIVPLMAVAYIVIVVYVVAVNYYKIPDILCLIIDDAFGIRQIVGGGVGIAILQGVKRGLLSNEAGMGSAPNAAAVATTEHPVSQGLIQALGVFIDTLVVCSCTAFVIFTSDIYSFGTESTGIALTQLALSDSVGAWAYQFIAVLIFFFGFSTCISNAYYGESNMRFIINNGWSVNTFRVLMVIFVAAGCIASLKFIWALADFLMIFVVLINLVSITSLGRYVYILLTDYKKQKRSGVDTPLFRKKDTSELDNEKIECW